jgi:hypothetical protein
MKELDISLITSINKGFSVFEKLKIPKSYKHYCIDLHTEWLKENPIESEAGGKYPVSEIIKEKFFRKFDEKDSELNKKVCLYAIEYPNEYTDYIINSLNEYRKNTKRNVSAIKTNPNKQGKILYIGKVKSGLGGRLSTHFGFAHEKTGGLQLRHWLHINMLLKVHIYAFDKELDDFVNPIELFLSKELKPLIGKSK